MSVRRSLAWSYVGQAITFLTTFATSIIVARLLTPREMGVFSLAIAVHGVMTIFATLNIGTYIIREGELTPEMVRSTFTANALMSLLLAIASAIAGAAEIFVFDERDIGFVLLLLSITPLLYILDFLPTTLFMREMNYRLLSSVGIVKTIITSSVTVAAAWHGYGPLSPATGAVAGAIFSAAFFTYRRWDDVILRPTRGGLRPIFVFGFQMLSIGGVAQLAGRGSDIILGRLLGLTALGLYSRASNLALLLFSNVYGLATGVLFVKLSNDLRDKGELHETFVRSLAMITAVMWPLVIGVGILAGPIIQTLYGPKWIEAASPLSLLMIAQFVVIAFGLNWELFVLRKETARQTRYEIYRAISGLAAFTIGCFYSITAAAIGRIVEAIVGYLLYRPHMDRLAGTATGQIERVYAESLLLTVAAAWPSLLVMLWSGWSPYASLPLILVAVATGIACWLGLIVWRRHPLSDELGLITRRLRRGRVSVAAE